VYYVGDFVAAVRRTGGLAAEADSIVTYNARNFVGMEKFGARVMTPGGFLKKIGRLR
jgi:hypothetical protein